MICSSTLTDCSTLVRVTSAWLWPVRIAFTTASVPDCSWPMRLCISTMAFWVRPARLRTSSATTAKPRPCSPARAASMAALSASRLVCSAIPWITTRMSLMLSLLAERCSTTGLASLITVISLDMASWVCATTDLPS